MGSVRLGVGTEWLLDERMFRIVRQLGPDNFVAEDLKFRREQTVSAGELLALYAEGRLRFASPAADAEPNMASQRGAVAVDASTMDRAVERWRAIEPLTRLDRPPTQEEFSARSAVLHAEGRRISPRSLRRWYSHWLRSGQQRLALSPNHARQGGRGRSRRHGWFRRFPQLKQFVDRELHEVYLTTARRPISAVVRRVLEDLERHNARTTACASPADPETRDTRPGHRAADRPIDPYEVDRAAGVGGSPISGTVRRRDKDWPPVFWSGSKSTILL